MPTLIGFHPLDRSPIFIVDPEPAAVMEPKAAADAAVTRVAAPGGTTTSARGDVIARIATLGRIDLDGDVLVSGVIGDGQDVVISGWNHGSWEKGTPMLPVGKGRLTEEGNALILRGKVWLDTDAGVQTFGALKGLAAAARWSFGFLIAEGGADRGSFGGQMVRFLRRLIVFECAPVLRAAGVNTGTVMLAGVDSLSLEVAQRARDIDVALAEARGWVPARKILGYHPTSGLPVYLSAVGRK